MNLSWVWLSMAAIGLAVQATGTDVGYMVVGCIIMSKLSMMHSDINR